MGKESGVDEGGSRGRGRRRRRMRKRKRRIVDKKREKMDGEKREEGGKEEK